MAGRWLSPKHRCELPSLEGCELDARWLCDCGVIWAVSSAKNVAKFWVRETPEFQSPNKII